MNHIVSSCNDCPFAHKLATQEVVCKNPSILPFDMKIESSKHWWEEDNLITPDDCPLKKENLTIVFDDKD